MPAYKTTARAGRGIAKEETFMMGMNYTNAPIQPGAVKLLVNFNFKNRGTVLTPRGGLRTYVAPQLFSSAVTKSFVHHIGQIQVTDASGVDTMERYVLIGTKDSAEDTTMLFSNCTILVEQPQASGDFIMATAVLIKGTAGYYKMLSKPQLSNLDMHGFRYTRESLGTIYSNLNNVLYIPVSYSDDDITYTNKWAQITLAWDADTAQYQATIDLVTPKAMTTSEAINYGYNMLSSTPYTFADTESLAVAAGYILLDGILPYSDEACTELCFNAHVGEQITLRLYARFPSAESPRSSYKFKWEIRDLDSDSITVYEDRTDAIAKGYEYSTTHSCAVDTAATDSKYIRLTIQSPYRRFSVTVTAYLSTDLTEPLQVLVLPSYTLTAEGNESDNIEVRAYDLTSAKDACIWNHRAVLTQVDSAPNIVFISDINTFSYFPYPNSAEPFGEKVLRCVPYLSDLLVFTESKLYRLTWAEDGLTFHKKVIQDNMYLTEAEARAITVVRNMVFFKNFNYYYMIVPSATSETGALLIAPISEPITNLLDDFQSEVLDTVMTVYNPFKFVTQTAGAEFSLALDDYYVFLDNTVLKNVYKFTLKYGDNTVLYFDYVLNYDTLQRVWYVHIMESNQERIYSYKQSATNNTVYMQAYNFPDLIDISEDEEEEELVDGYNKYIEFMKTGVPSDNFVLVQGLHNGARRFPNYQYMDTGYRAMGMQVKQRFREIIFKINNISQKSLRFGTEFIIDDSRRKDLYKYTAVQASTDPSDPDFGWFYLDREPNDTELSIGAMLLADETLDPLDPSGIMVTGELLESSQFVLDFSKLGNVGVSTIRFRVSGKGYSPRLKLLSFNEENYEYLEHSFVARTMNGR